MSVRLTSKPSLPSPPARLDPSFFERLFEGAGLAVYACDPRGLIVGWNELAETLFRECATGPDAGTVRSVIPEPDRPTFDESLNKCVESGESLEFRTSLRRGLGESSDYAVWITPLRSDEDAITGVSVWFHDITARLQIRRRIRKDERLSTLGTLSGAIAHHYNNLLCGIATSLEYALNLNTMSAMRRALHRTADAVNRAAQLTQQLLAFAQGDHRDEELSELTDVVRTYCDENQRPLSEVHIELACQISAIPPCFVPRRHLQIVLNNLVENSREAMPEGGTITISLSQANSDFARITVSDTGPGIPPEHMEHLFEPFFTTKGEMCAGAFRKPGMGLAVAHGLVGEMHGAISAANEPAGGARFEILIPLGRPD